jgi:small nuclear ribonucleoprotein
VSKLAADMTFKVLNDSVGKVVLIKLKGNKVIRGSLQGFDQHMNLILESSEEMFPDGKANPLGTIIVRGDNVVLISPPPETGEAGKQ